jgi:hypothetical protein
VRVGVVDPGPLLAVLIPVLIALSVYLCGKRLAVGWLIGLLVQVLNAAYAVVTEHWGWLLGPLLIGPLFAKNWLVWRREDRQVAADAAEAPPLPGRHHRDPGCEPAAESAKDGA